MAIVIGITLNILVLSGLANQSKSDSILIIANWRLIGVPHFLSVFFACLYQKYLSENIEHPSAVFFGIDEQEVRKNKTINKILFFTIYPHFFSHFGSKFIFQMPNFFDLAYNCSLAYFFFEYLT